MLSDVSLGILSNLARDFVEACSDAPRGPDDDGIFWDPGILKDITDMPYCNLGGAAASRKTQAGPLSGERPRSSLVSAGENKRNNGKIKQSRKIFVEGLFFILVMSEH